MTIEQPSDRHPGGSPVTPAGTGPKLLIIYVGSIFSGTIQRMDHVGVVTFAARGIIVALAEQPN
jgi:hypothetical protein